MHPDNLIAWGLHHVPITRMSPGARLLLLVLCAKLARRASQRPPEAGPDPMRLNCSAAQLGRWCGLSRHSATHAVAALVEAGLITTAPTGDRSRPLLVRLCTERTSNAEAA